MGRYYIPGNESEKGKVLSLSLKSNADDVTADGRLPGFCRRNTKRSVADCSETCLVIIIIVVVIIHFIESCHFNSTLRYTQTTQLHVKHTNVKTCAFVHLEAASFTPCTVNTSK